jgi:hypothetical protein
MAARGVKNCRAAAMPAEWAELDDAEAAGRVKVGIETERGPWVAALIAAGYEGLCCVVRWLGVGHWSDVQLSVALVRSGGVPVPA